MALVSLYAQYNANWNMTQRVIGYRWKLQRTLWA
ncbi:MAG: hypothetical protein ACI8WB_001951, partial [Phenylobacterium sp.]